MANKQIQELPDAAPANDDDLLLVSQGGRARRKRLGTLRGEAFSDAGIAATGQGALTGTTVRAQLGELDGRTSGEAAARTAADAANAAAAGTAQTTANAAQAVGTAAQTTANAAQTTAAAAQSTANAAQTSAAAAQSTANAVQTTVAAAQTAASAAQTAAAAAQSTANAAQTAATGAVPRAAATAATPANDVQLYGRDNGGTPLAAAVGNLPSSWLGGLTGEQSRPLGKKLGDSASVRDFGAVGDGVTDDSAAFQAAVNACSSVRIPAGRYLLASEVQVKPRRALIGAGRDTTVIVAQGPRAFTFNANAGANAVEPTGTPDWNRSRIAQLSMVMTTGGIRVQGHEFHAQGLRFSGGAPSGWCMELIDANECSLREISAGPGGGGDDLLANGIHFYGSTASPAVNFGDSLLEEISIKLKSPGTIGILIEHQGAVVGASTYYVMNNLMLNRVQVNSASPPSGSIGIWLKRVMRAALVNVDVEFLDTAFKVEGVAASGNAGSCRHVSFVNCYVLNCNTPWVDSNATLGGSVMRCFFSNCNGFSPVGAVGISSTDANAHAGEGDVSLPSALWLHEPNAGQAAIQLRSTNVGQLILTGDFYDGTSAVRDSNVKNRIPRQGLGVDITSFNVTQLYRPRGYSLNNLSRLLLGNGETFKPDGTTAAPLHRVEITDPLLLSARATEPPQAQDGLVIYVPGTGILPTGTPWAGQGWYSRLNNGWVPGVNLPGRVPDKERNASFQLTPLDFGQVNRMNSASALTVTISSTYDPGSGTQTPLMSAGDPDAIVWFVRQGTGAVTLQAGDTGVQVLSADGGTTMKIGRQYQLVAVVLRYNTTSSKIELYSTSYPDADFSYNEATAWTNASQGTNTDTTPYVVASSRAGQLIRISSSDAVSYVAFDASSVPSGLTCAMFRLVAISHPIAIMAKSGSGLSLKRTSGTSTPGSLPIYTVAELGRVVTVHVTPSTDPNQANAIYIEG